MIFKDIVQVDAKTTILLPRDPDDTYDYDAVIYAAFPNTARIASYGGYENAIAFEESK